MLIDRILSYEIDDPQSSFKFSDRLAQENMWTKEYSLRVIEEYKKFMYLAAKYGNVTPSIQVDECWHLHMIYTRDYWLQFCKEVIGVPIQHGPTRGGKQEDDKYMMQYAQTLQWYEDEFGEEVPLDIWPPVFNRFEPDRRVKIDLATHWVIPVGDWKALLRVFKNHIKSKLKL
jgi:hypothetical protein